ncbi:MAG: AmmeMemoRadiSam system protein B [Candidatus Woykebacteria bacterium GWB1_45_5]|uniref:AmmeMemoRadiSam system protein B n=2 Tax=Candidatus Woykeibacteriota TaxID=1817899 RepID=A0A1G1VZZ3_9BACT|nr:MAG: AmmeMemoRadiSam system protein B [Candidatus Woykebacteria bacterium GWA1_44_8]OGY24759.1 MAG: AmmeMemoRadiSam system protein B [Candidatus Woykebacteria bacterium GWB1_45_5]
MIPHHLLPSFMIADFFNRLSAQEPNTIILLGPNHDELGDFEVLTSLYGWQTPFGTVEPNDAIINSLINNNLAKVDEDVLAKETSVSAIVPFIKFYLPKAKVVPLILSARMTQDETRTLANDLKNRLSNKTVIVAAVDFSHYLTSPLAKEKDELTWQVMKNFDYRQLFTLNNDYLDNPPSIATLLMAMQKRGTTNFDLLYHTNSGELLKDSSISTTSYFSIDFH